LKTSAPALRDLVLVGGGHSHVQVVKTFGMRPLPGLRLTLVSREYDTPYSGMLPGCVAGRYQRRAMHIDLARLCAFAGARFIADAVHGLDPSRRELRLDAHPPLRYDLLSLNSGATPRLPEAVAADMAERVIAVKPIGRFLPRWEALRQRLRDGERVIVVGGGAGGVELALAMRNRLPAAVELRLVTDRLLPDLAPAATARLRAALARQGVALMEGVRVDGYRDGAVWLEGGNSVAGDRFVVVTGVEAPRWVAESGLAVDERGFVCVDDRLRSCSHDDVFAAGDLAAMRDQPRAKAGVFAVRQGPVLAENLRRAVQGRALRRYRAQSRFLVLVGTGDGRAVASRGDWAAEGRWVWWWKDWIDRRFMKRFNALPVMAVPDWSLPAALRAEAPDPMRCGGCGAKLGADPLRRALARLPVHQPPSVLLGLGDDAAVIRLSADTLVQTVDGLKAFVDDPYRFGRITAQHAMNDLLAMGARGLSALALVTLPLMADAMMEDDLVQLLSGVLAGLDEHGVPLVGGHSGEGESLHLALSLTGVADGPPLRKAGLEAGQRLVITKALGTGTLLAAHMRARLPSAQLEAALAAMEQSNGPALAVLRDHGVRALTDVSGFGLLGHLGEMLRASGPAVGVDLSLPALPWLPGAAEQFRSGVGSSLQSNNEAALADFDGATGDWRARLAVDPQTSGGLLAALPAEQAERCVAALRGAGYEAAEAIGTVTGGAWRLLP